MHQKLNFLPKPMWLFGVGLGILFPIFFQLSGGLYRDAGLMLDSHGVLATLPLPVSIVTCFAAIAFLAGGLGRARPALAMIFGTIVVCFISLWLGGDGVTPPQRKLIMIMQVILPLAGLLLGQLVDDKGEVIAVAFLVVLSLIIPWQLLATWMQGEQILTHYLYAFSIYSHRQYVTLIFVCAFVYALTSLWGERRLWLGILTIPVFVYVTRSYSFLTILAFGCFMMAFVARRLWAYRENAPRAIVALTLIAMTALGGSIYFGKMDGPGTSNLFLGKFTELSEGNIPGNVQERFGDWKLFGGRIVESPKTILVGHPQPMPREIKTSPHNYYIDIAYTFGLISWLPLMALIGYTAKLCWIRRKTLAEQTWWLAAIVFYLVIIDSNFKVTLRQPYPGIFAYFMWGLLLSRLRTTESARPGP